MKYPQCSLAIRLVLNIPTQSGGHSTKVQFHCRPSMQKPQNPGGLCGFDLESRWSPECVCEPAEAILRPGIAKMHESDLWQLKSRVFGAPWAKASETSRSAYKKASSASPFSAPHQLALPLVPLRSPAAALSHGTFQMREAFCPHWPIWQPHARWSA